MLNTPTTDRAYPGFELKRLLGVGATAEVFAAMNLTRHMPVALKVFSPMVSRDPELVKRLEDEAAILSRLKHPNVVSTYGVRNEGGSFALELELIEGQDLRQWMMGTAKELTLTEPKLWVLAQIARGLGAAHEIGALHRDLKPENILLSLTGEVKITDFGLARTVTRVTLTRVGLLVGSLGYLAPEVINGFRAREQSDIYSLGVMAYELLTGEAPFVGETPQTLIQLMTNGRFTPLCERAPYLPHAIGQLIDRTLNPKPEFRPATVWEFEAALMHELSRSGIMRFSKAVLAESISASGFEHQTEALREKHLGLITRLKTPEATAFDLAEFHRLFPNDEELPALIAAFGAKNSHQLGQRRKLPAPLWRLRLSAAFLQLFRSGAVALTWPKLMSRRHHPQSINPRRPKSRYRRRHQRIHQSPLPKKALCRLRYRTMSACMFETSSYPVTNSGATGSRQGSIQCELKKKASCRLRGRSMSKRDASR
ncbi:MAG: serine/threonine protein kinase [Bdellovibrionales bacterium]|nr:serine/threonine protein kinase [Bdellovibrionales bacterium]